MGRLVELAEAILRDAKLLEAQLKAASAPPRTLDAGGPIPYPNWSEYPDIFKTRSGLIDTSKEMYQVALGPGDTVRDIVGPAKMEAFVVNVIERFDIANIVTKEGSISVMDLATKISVQPEILERILHFASSKNFFKIDQNGQITHTALSEAIPVLSGWSRLLNRREINSALSSWPQSLEVDSEAVSPSTHQIPWNIGNDMDASFFEFLNAEKDGMTNFGNAMKSHTAVAGADTSYIVDGFDWESLGSGPVVDVGGGNGHVAVMLAEKFPKLRFVIQDLASSEESANALIPAHLKDRISFRVQDLFQPQTEHLQAKVFFLRAIMHDWQDDECVDILRNLLPEVERGAKVILCDRVSPPRGRKATQIESFILFMDLLMFSLLGAKERSVDQWKALIQRTDPRLQLLSLAQPAGSEYGLLVVSM